MLRARRLRHLAVSAAVCALVLTGAASARAEPPPANLQKQITEQSAAIKRLGEQYNAVKEQLKQTKAEAARHASSLPALERDRSEAEVQVRDIAVTAYRTGHLRNAAALLADKGPGALLQRLSSLDHLAKTRQERLSALSAAQQRYAAVKQQLATAERKQAALLRSLAASKKKGEADLEKLYEMRRQAYGQAQETGGGYTGSVPSVSGKAGIAVRFAYNAIGKPYVWAADGPNGYDCSGLTLAAWRAAGKSLPHNTNMQWNVVARISRSQLKPGDLVFYADLGHMGIYVGNNKVIHAPTFGEQVKISSIDMMPLYGYGRVR